MTLTMTAPIGSPVVHRPSANAAPCAHRAASAHPSGRRKTLRVRSLCAVHATARASDRPTPRRGSFEVLAQPVSSGASRHVAVRGCWLHTSCLSSLPSTGCEGGTYGDCAASAQAARVGTVGSKKAQHSAVQGGGDCTALTLLIVFITPPHRRVFMSSHSSHTLLFAFREQGRLGRAGTCAEGDGEVTPREAASLEKRQGVASRRHYRLKHDAQTRQP